MVFEFKLPDIGEGVHEGEIVRWLVQSGGSVTEDQPLVEVMTDKVTAEIPSPRSGKILELRGKPGDTVPVGAVLAVLDEVSGLSGNTLRQPKTSVATSGAVSGACTDRPPKDRPCDSESSAGRSSDRVPAAPATRKMARELGVDLSRVSGSGPHGRITPQDVRAFANVPTLPAREVQRAEENSFLSRGERRMPFVGLRRKIAENLVRAKQTAPHFAYVEEVDASRLVELREELRPFAEARGVTLNYLPFVVKAVIEGLRQHPILNARLDDAAQEVVYSNDYHIGVAVATDQGLIVPVVKFADRKNLLMIAEEIATLAKKARDNTLSLEDLRGGTFTLTGIGSIGGLLSVPIINYPEVAILGINKIKKRPVVRTVDGGDQIVIREMMNLSISCDHRVVDGAEAALFMKEVIRCLEHPVGLLMTQTDQ